MTRLDAKLDRVVDALDEKFSNLSPRVVTLEHEVAQLKRERDAQAERADRSERETISHRRNVKIAAGGSLTAIVAALVPYLDKVIGG